MDKGEIKTTFIGNNIYNFFLVFIGLKILFSLGFFNFYWNLLGTLSDKVNVYFGHIM